MLEGTISAESLQKFRESIYADNVIVKEEEGQIEGFVFSSQRTAEVTLAADITDFYTEDNTVLHDHIAIKPVRITLTGYVGEKVMTKRTFAEKFMQAFNTRLIPIVDLYPKLTNRTQYIYDSIELGIKEVKNVFLKTDTIWSVSLLATQQDTKQQQAFKYFEALLNNRQLVRVVTPYKVFSNMAIESLRATQGEKTTDVSDFSITLKQINTVVTKFYVSGPLIADSGSFNSLQGQESVKRLNSFKEETFKTFNFPNFFESGTAVAV